LSSVSNSSRMRVSTASGSLRVTITFGLRGAMEGSEVGGSARDIVVAGPTKTGFAGQARGNWPRAAFLGAVLALTAGALTACNGPVAEGRDCPAAARAHSVSGFCVPRYVSLKRGEVYGRKGPGKDYPAVWIYRAKGLPVQVIAETSDWRRICDPEGGATWVNRAMVDGRRTVMAVGAGDVTLQKTAKAGAAASARLAPRTLANLERCQGDVCLVSVAGVSGCVT